MPETLTHSLIVKSVTQMKANESVYQSHWNYTFMYSRYAEEVRSLFSNTQTHFNAFLSKNSFYLKSRPSLWFFKSHWVLLTDLTKHFKVLRFCTPTCTLWGSRSPILLHFLVCLAPVSAKNTRHFLVPPRTNHRTGSAVDPVDSMSSGSFTGTPDCCHSPFLPV